VLVKVGGTVENEGHGLQQLTKSCIPKNQSKTKMEKYNLNRARSSKKRLTGKGTGRRWQKLHFGININLKGAG